MILGKFFFYLHCQNVEWRHKKYTIIKVGSIVMWPNLTGKGFRIQVIQNDSYKLDTRHYFFGV